MYAAFGANPTQQVNNPIPHWRLVIPLLLVVGLQLTLLTYVTIGW
jgi:hypothetical protein